MDTKVKLSDADIKEVKKGRRAFLMAGLGATGLLGVLTVNACSHSDRCDADIVTDRDVRDPANRPLDRCDSDGR
jgi:hypothetical protein